MSKIFIGRQPIFDRTQGVVAYELLFRPGDTESAGQLDGNIATAQVIQNSLLEIGLDNLVDNKIAHINFPYDFLINQLGEVLPAERMVLEILEDVQPDKESLAGVTQLSEAGFKIALDDFKYSPEWEPFIELASVIKLDVFGKDPASVQKEYDFLQKYGVSLLAEKVETSEQYYSCREMGFDYFQGYFFAKPNVVQQSKLPDNQLALLELISKLQNPDISVAEAEQLISQTVSLNYKLFRYVNSAYFNLPRQFESLREVITYIGLKKLKNLASLLALTDTNVSFSELITLGLTRAKMCELLATMSGSKEPERFFVTGLFSILEPLIDSPLDLILASLPLTEDIVDALLNNRGELGNALQCCLASEQCTWNKVNFGRLQSSQINDAYWEAIKWAHDASGSIT